jgi:hypothetical protein
VLLALIFVILTGGCSSSGVQSQVAIQMIGTPLDHAQVSDLEKKLMGQPIQSALDELGPAIDILKDLNSSRQWFVFRIDPNTLGQYRYVVEVNNNCISAVSKVQIGGVTGADYPRRYILRDKVMGKFPDQCQKELGLGAPLLSVKSEKTRRLTEFYDARQSKGNKIYYCIVRYNPTNNCENLAFITVDASTKQTASR